MLSLSREFFEYARKPLAASRDMRAGGLIHHPGAECLHTLLEPGELGDFRGLAVADHDIRLMTDDGLHQLADGRARVLVVAIGVHHDVGTMLERVIHAIAERTGPSPSAWHGGPRAAHQGIVPPPRCCLSSRHR